MGAFQFESIRYLQLVSEHKLKIMSLIFLVPLSALICTVIGDLAEPCRNTGDRYFVSDSQQCDRFHMCDENGALAAEFLCEDVPRRSCTGSPVPRASLSPGTLLSLIAGPSSHVLSTLITTPDLVAVQSVLFTILIARFVMSQRMCLHVKIITRVSFI